MSPPITQDKVKGMLADVIKEKFGMTPESLKEMQAELARLKSENDAIRRQHTADIAAQNRPSTYARKAASFIRTDKHKGIGLRAARMVRALIAAKIGNQTPEAIAKSWDDAELADEIVAARDMQTKALAAGTLADGGALIPPEQAAEIIELLRAMSVMRAAGVPSIDMPRGKLSIGRQATAATAAYTGENTNIASSQPSLDMIELVAKKLAALVPVSNDLIRASSPSADAWVRDDLVRVLALREDLAFLRGDGTVYGPKGVRYRTASANINARTQASSANTLTTITNDLLGAMSLVDQANVPMMGCFWVMHARTKYNLGKIRDSLGNLIFWQDLQKGELWGWPVFVSNQIPINLGGGSESEVYFITGTQCIIGDHVPLMVDVFNGGTYYDSSASALASGISQDQTVIRGITEHDFTMRHSQAAAIITTVDW